jgi:uncharacterized protein (TIGR00730 family)
MSKLLCVYCSSSDRLDSKYYETADALGAAMVAHGWDLVYGGGRVGMMGRVARATHAAGGRVLGVIPNFMVSKELAYDESDELITVDTMRTRKGVMEQKADGFVALPGGWGTLEEIMEIITLRQLDVVRKPCVFLNQDGFYDDLLHFFQRMVNERFNKPSNLQLFHVARNVAEVFPLLEESGRVRAETKWFDTK